MLVRINNQIRKGNGRKGVFSISVSYGVFQKHYPFESRAPWPPLWRGSLRSNTERAAYIPKKTWNLLKEMRKVPESFNARISYSGPQRKPFYSAILKHIETLTQRELTNLIKENP